MHPRTVCAFRGKPRIIPVVGIAKMPLQASIFAFGITGIKSQGKPCSRALCALSAASRGIIPVVGITKILLQASIFVLGINNCQVVILTIGGDYFEDKEREKAYAEGSV